MEHATVHVISKHTVQSADLAMPDSIASVSFPYLLGPLDHLGSPVIPVGVVWAYEFSGTCLKPVAIETLTLALSRLLDYYPHLTGRLTIDSSTGVRSIDRQATGIHLYEARCGATLSEFYDASTEKPSLGPGHVSRVSVALLAPWEASEHSIQREPLLRVQHTRFACGSVALGIRLARVMAGAGGFLQLFRHLAEIYRAIAHDIKEPTLEDPPHNTPFMAEEMDKPLSTDEVKATVLAQPTGYSTERIAEEPVAAPDAQGIQTPNTTTPASPVVGRELRFKASELAALKASAMPPDGESFVTTFSALSAHIWQRAQVARSKTQTSTQGESDSALQQCSFFTSVDFASKIGLPHPCFPSTVVTPSVQLSASDLIDAPLWRIAKAIYDTTRAVSPETVRNLAEWVVAQPRKQDIRQTVAFGTNSVITTAWNKNSLYAGGDLDVKPTIACVPFTPTNLVDGLGFFISPREENGDIVAVLALNQAVWDTLDKDVAFRYFKAASDKP